MRCHPVLILLLPVLAAAQPSQRERLRPDPEQAKAGRELYNRSCTMCHGLDGAAGDRAPALGAQRRYLRSSRDELFDAIKNGIGGTAMPASPLPEADVNKIVAFIHSLRATAADVEVPGNASAGEAVFHGKGKCIDCHMVRGRGGILGPDLTRIGAERRLEDLRASLTTRKPPSRGFQPVTVVTKAGARIEGVARNEHNTSIQVLGKDQKLHMFTQDEIQEVRHEEQSVMPSDAAQRLSPDELQNLLAFLARQTGRRQAQ